MESTSHISVQYVDGDEGFDLVYSIRAQVFQFEHGVEEESELDGHEHISHHYLAYVDGEAVGTARWRMTLGGKVKLERFAVLKEWRGMGVGAALCETILANIPSGPDVFLEALEEVTGFYGKFGFENEGECYLAEGLLHRKMVLRR